MSPDVGAKDEVLTQVRREETAGIRILAYRAGEFAGRKGDPESRKSERMRGTQNVMSPDAVEKDEVLTQVRREETAGIRIRAGRAGDFAGRKDDPESRKSERMGGLKMP